MLGVNFTDLEKAAQPGRSNEQVFKKIKRIINDPGYCRNANDQKVIETVLVRITSAIRATFTIDRYCTELIDLLESCLRHEMVASGRYGMQDTPYCKIAIIILDTLFSYCEMKEVMERTIPAAINALKQHGSINLRDRTSNGLARAAMHNSPLLAQYSRHVISSIIYDGNYTLIKVIPLLYPSNKIPFHAHLPRLMRLLKNPDIEEKEQLAVLKFAKLVASYEPDLIVGYLGELDPLLHFPSTQIAVLYIYRTLIAKNDTRSLVPRIDALRTAVLGTECDKSLSMFAQVFGSIGKCEQYKAKEATEILIMMCRRLSDSLPIILKEIEGIAEVSPDAVRPHLSFIASLPEARPAIAAICLKIESVCSNDNRICKEVLYSSPNDAVTIINTENVMFSDHSQDSVYSKCCLKGDSSTIQSDIRTTIDINDSAKNSASELDKNTENLAFIYKRIRSSLSTNSVPGFNSHGDNAVSVDSTSRGSPVSNVSSHAHTPRRCDGIIYTPLPLSPHHSSRNNTNYTPSSSSKSSRAPSYKTTRAQPWVSSSAGGSICETTFPPTCGPPTTKIASGSGSNIEVIEEETSALMPSCSGAVCSSSSVLVEPGKKDLVSSYVERRQDEIRNYIAEHLKSYPIPVQCTVEGTKGSKSRMRVHFRCQMNGPHCEFNSENLFAFKTRVASIWLHLMFLQMEATSLETTGEVIPQSSKAFQTLSKCWSCLSSTLTRSRHFTTLVTSKFPLLKEQQQIYKELQEAHYFDSFTYNPQKQKWCCYSCNHPERVRSLLRSNSPNIPVLEGQLKEKRGRWKFLKRWHTKYFTLSSAALTCRERDSGAKNKMICPSIDLRKIRSVKSLSKGRKSRKSLPKAFEIFTDDHISYILKAHDQNQAQEWFQSIQIAVAQAHKEGQATYAL
uniref:PH domain-containing protein n=1 Tax=Syphacia muris TaxID=451379 RepID=A0A0N5AWX3_9BILA